MTWAGPKNPKILIVGEAWGESEEMTRKPFVGHAGRELFKMLGEANPQLAPELHQKITLGMNYGAAWVRGREDWLAEAGIAMTSCFNVKPLGNKIDGLCETKKENKNASPSMQISRGQYLQSKYLPELERLRQEIASANANLLVACGNATCWAVLQSSGISSIRGSVATGPAGGYAPGQKILPTYSPWGIMRQWEFRPILVADLIKASREGQFPEIRRPKREVLISPSIGEAEQWTRETLAKPPPLLACDIETASKMITEIGFARSRGEAMVLPFGNSAYPGGNYWPTSQEERRAWICVQQLLCSNIPKVFQNGLFDLQYLTKMPLRPNAILEDTMLLHHSLYPEMRKGLGFLGSIYTDEASWKLMNRPKADAIIKKDS